MTSALFIPQTCTFCTGGSSSCYSKPNESRCTLIGSRCRTGVTAPSCTVIRRVARRMAGRSCSLIPSFISLPRGSVSICAPCLGWGSISGAIRSFSCSRPSWSPRPTSISGSRTLCTSPLMGTAKGCSASWSTGSLTTWFLAFLLMSQ